MRIDILTNTTPIFAGDEIGIAIRPSGWDYTSLWYSLHLLGPTGTRTLAPMISPFDLEFDWTVDAVGAGIVVRADSHRPIGIVSAFSGPLTILPDPPKLTAPHDDETLHAGGPYTFQWTQNPPHADKYRVLFSTNGGQHFDQLGADVPGTARSASRDVPAAATDDAKVVVEGIFTGFPPSFRELTQVRTTTAPVVTVLRPTAGSIDSIGEQGTISWQAAGDIDHFVVRLSRDGSSWTTLASSLPGSARAMQFSVDPPASDHCRVRVEALGPTGSTSDDSGIFRIRAPHRGHGPRD